MKKTKQQIIKKVRSRANHDIYYTSPQWDIREIEGVVFIPVVKMPPNGKHQTIHWMRKESMEYIK